MDLQQLRYAVAVAECGSINKAAQKLYMGQPNLSKGLRELEGEIGRPLFRRTAHGVEPTSVGAEFLIYARTILEQMDSLTAMYHPQAGDELRFSACVPRASYIADAFSRWAQQYAVPPMHLRYRETNTAATLDAVSLEEAQVGIVRYQRRDAAYFENTVLAHGLHQAPLWEFSMTLLMHEAHPLAHLDAIPFSSLAAYPRLVHGDFAPMGPQDEASAAPQAAPGGEIAVYDRAGQFDMLRSVAGSYMWVSPMPAAVLARQGLVQRPCRSGTLYRDAAVWKGKLSEPASRFLDCVRAGISELVQQKDRTP